ncbi:hypothetical protein GKQ38_03415 [Candidatus Nanohaloarchaea archaeon]|nr:hypothetical protein GKQ38_03415 [Candidatus Nanohaloarchaea archaeon]
MEEENFEDQLVDSTRDMLKEEFGGSEGFELDKSNEFDEKLESEANSKNTNWSSEELEFLAQNRTSMDNEEMEEFLKGEKDFQREDHGSFSSTEEKFILQNYQAKTVDEIAEELDRSPRAVEMQLRIMGLGDQVDR